MKQYKIGMYGGKFLPFHKGHKYCVDTAASHRLDELGEAEPDEECGK